MPNQREGPQAEPDTIISLNEQIYQSIVLAMNFGFNLPNPEP